MARQPYPTYSIVIPCYNEAGYIGETLTSLKNQRTSVDYEIIIVDNNCTDETVAIAKQYGAIIVTEKEPGVTAARQTGTLAAQGEIVISTDADTVLAPTWLETIHQDLTNHPEAVAVCGPCRFVDGPKWSAIYTTILFGSSAQYAKWFKHPFYVSATNIAFKKSAWHGYNSHVPQGGDELGLLHDLKREGVVLFNNKNPTFTSSRRLTKGFVYSFFVTFLYYYVIGYNLDRLFDRSIIGSAPSFRKSGFIKAPSITFQRPSINNVGLSVLVAMSPFGPDIADELLTIPAFMASFMQSIK